MSPQYPPPHPAAFALLKSAPALAAPEQQAILSQYQTGEIGIETTVYLLMQEVKERYPALKTAREAEADERATRAREQREMAENEKAAGPTFVDYTPEGRPANEPEPIPPFSRVGIMPTPVGAVATVAAAVVVAAEPEPEIVETVVPADEAAAPHEEPKEDDQAEDDADWVGQGQEDEPEYVSDEE